MKDTEKGRLAPSDDLYDLARFDAALQGVRGEVEALAAGCADDVVYRDAVTVACEEIRVRLALLRHRCERDGAA